MRALETRRGLILLPLLLAVALLGYLAGHSKSQAAPGSAKTLTASVANVVLNYPPSWRPSGAPPQIPRLALSHALLLSPAGQAGRAGLITGQLPAAESDPVPHQFMASTPLQGAEIVTLPEAQAYRYARLRIPGFGHEVTLYTIPSPAGPSTALACYALPTAPAEMAACEKIISTLTLVGQSQNSDLTPTPAYARKLNTWIGSLDRERLSVRGALASQAPAAARQALAARLASLFANAAAGLSALEGSQAVGAAQAQLAATLWHARDAYTALASRATLEDPARLASAQRQIDAAEASVNEALQRFAWLGYARS